ISRDALAFRVVAWIGPGAEKSGLPDAMQIAREALAEYRQREEPNPQPGNRLLPQKETSMTDTPKYQHVTVRLTGEDGNAFMILARVNKALRRADVPTAEIDEFMAEAKSGNY